MTHLPVFDLAGLAVTDACGFNAVQLQLCEKIAECLRATGCLIVKDQRVSSDDNDRFLDTLEQYFGQEDEAKKPDIREQLSYQVGLTPEGIEKPRLLIDELLQREVEQLPEQHKAILPRTADVKCRFFWRCGPRPACTAYPELNADPVIPKAFPQWSEVMDGFGGRLLSVSHTVARCVAAGLGLPATSLLQAMEGGPHLLAPTGSNLSRHGELGTVLAGYHSDMNLLTVHGKSRFPGLHVWLADGTRMTVKVPPGCLLVQAGQQLEWLTGGAIQAGKHEVVVTEDTRAAVAAAQQAGRSCWRVSSTLFVHVASDYVLQPLGHFASTATAQRFPPTPAGLQVQRELEAISLRVTDQPSTVQSQTNQLATGPNTGAVPEQVQVDVTLAAQRQCQWGEASPEKPGFQPSAMFLSAPVL